MKSVKNQVWVIRKSGVAEGQAHSWPQALKGLCTRLGVERFCIDVINDRLVTFQPMSAGHSSGVYTIERIS